MEVEEEISALTQHEGRLSYMTPSPDKQMGRYESVTLDVVSSQDAPLAKELANLQDEAEVDLAKKREKLEVLKTLQKRYDYYKSVKLFDEAAIAEKRLARIKKNYVSYPTELSYNTEMTVEDLVEQVEHCAALSENSESLYGSSILSEITLSDDDLRKDYFTAPFRDIKNDIFLKEYDYQSNVAKMVKEAEKRLVYRIQKAQRCGFKPRAKPKLPFAKGSIEELRKKGIYSDLTMVISESALNESYERVKFYPGSKPIKQKKSGKKKEESLPRVPNPPKPPVEDNDMESLMMITDTEKEEL